MRTLPPKSAGRSIPLLLAFLLAATGCLPGAAGSPRVAAVVEGEEITISEVEARFESVSQNPQVQSQLQFDEDGSIRRQIQAQVLGQLIQSRLLEVGARRLGVELTEADVIQTREAIVAEVGGQEAFDLIIEQNNLSEEDVNAQLRDIALQEQIQEAVAAQVTVTEEEIAQAYEQNRESRYERASARHIMVGTEAEGEAVLARLAEGEDFAALAQELSLDQGSAMEGGDLGEFSRGRYPEPFEDAVFAAEEGALLGPLQIGDTWHVVDVTSLETVSLAGAADEIREELLEQRRGDAFAQWQQEEAARAEITVNPRFGRWDEINGQVVLGDPLGDTRFPVPEGLRESPAGGVPDGLDLEQ